MVQSSSTAVAATRPSASITVAASDMRATPSPVAAATTYRRCARRIGESNHAHHGEPDADRCVLAHQPGTHLRGAQRLHRGAPRRGFRGASSQPQHRDSEEDGGGPAGPGRGGGGTVGEKRAQPPTLLLRGEMRLDVQRERAQHAAGNDDQHGDGDPKRRGSTAQVQQLGDRSQAPNAAGVRHRVAL